MDEETSFDHIVAILGVRPDQYKDSLTLKEWVRQNKDEKYVPPELLVHWGIRGRRGCLKIKSLSPRWV